MPDEIRVSRPAASAPQAMPMTPEMPEPAEKSKMPWIVLGVVVLVIIVLGVLFRGQLFGAKKGAVKGTSTGASGYQAVFLTNGQVYFGKIANADSAYATLTDIFYLQVVQPPLQGQQQPGQEQPATQPQISLVKLGNELHGPVDEMKINRDQILFYEDLKAEGQVVQAINNYKAAPQK